MYDGLWKKTRSKVERRRMLCNESEILISFAIVAKNEWLRSGSDKTERAQENLRTENA
jgi:hypothetical protein